MIRSVVVCQEKEKKGHKPTTSQSTMAALLPTILSDNEDEDDAKALSLSKSGGKAKKRKAKKAEKVQRPLDDGDDDGSSSSASSGDEMDGDFEFGGLLVSHSSSCFLRLCCLTTV